MPIIITVLAQAVLSVAGIALLGAAILHVACHGLDGVPEEEMK